MKNIDEKNNSDNITYIKWDNSKINEFKILLNSKNDELTTLTNSIESENIDVITEHFSQFMQQATMQK